MSANADAPMARIVDDLYSGTLEEDAWSRALIGIADLVRASAALLLAFDPASGEILRAENHRFDPSALAEYRRHWIYEDPRFAPFMAIPVGEPVTEQSLTIGNWRQSAILNEFLLGAADAPYFMPAWLHKSRNKVVAFALEGTRKRGPFERHDVAKVRSLLPHLKRALEIRDRLERCQVRADTFSRCLDHLSFGVVLLDGTGRVLDANTAVQELFRVGSGVTCQPDGTLRLGGSADVELRRWILSAHEVHATHAVWHIRRSHGPRLSVVIIPLALRGTAWTGIDPRWLVLIFDPGRNVRASSELVARDLGISLREAEIACLLLAGSHLHQIASKLSVSINTVRSHLKAVFAKTGCASQADLIRRLAMGPPALQGLATVESSPHATDLR